MLKRTLLLILFFIQNFKRILRKILRFIKKILPEYLPIPYFYKLSLRFLILPKHHWTQYIQKTYEPETFKKIKEIFKDNQIKSFWDIGANAGIYTVFVSKKYDCIVNSFEPTKKYNSILKLNTSFFDNTHVHNFGIGREDNKAKIILTEEPGSNYISLNVKINNEKNTEICELRSIKNLTEITAPCLVKIDVEGFEYEILENSIDFFRTNKTILIIEIDEENLIRYSKNKKDIFDLLNSKNYFIERISKSNNYYCFL